MVKIVVGALVLVMVILWAVAARWGCYDGQYCLWGVCFLLFAIVGGNGVVRQEFVEGWGIRGWGQDWREG